MFNLISSNFKKNCEIVIEDKANGQAIIKTLESIFKGRAIIKAVNPLGSKRARLMSVATFFENHEVVFLKNPIWASYDKLYGKEPGTPLHELILKQFVYFGYAANDDIPDSVGQGLLEMLDDGEPISIISISTDRLNSKIDWSDREQKVYGKIF